MKKVFCLLILSTSLSLHAEIYISLFTQDVRIETITPPNNNKLDPEDERAVVRKVNGMFEEIHPLKGEWVRLPPMLAPTSFNDNVAEARVLVPVLSNSAAPLNPTSNFRVIRARLTVFIGDELIGGLEFEDPATVYHEIEFFDDEQGGTSVRLSPSMRLALGRKLAGKLDGKEGLPVKMNLEFDLPSDMPIRVFPVALGGMDMKWFKELMFLTPGRLASPAYYVAVCTDLLSGKNR